MTKPANPESLAAYSQVADTTEETRRRIMAFAVERGAFGFIVDKLASAWECSHNHVAPRVLELKRAGELCKTNRQRRTRAGCLARVLIAAEEQRDVNRPPNLQVATEPQPLPAGAVDQARLFAESPQPYRDPEESGQAVRR